MFEMASLSCSPSFCSALLAFGGCSPQNLAAAKGEQGRSAKFNPRACARNLGNRAAGPQGPSRMPCLPEFGDTRMLSRIAKAGTYSRQRQE